jgi:hypothetical protein
MLYFFGLARLLVIHFTGFLINFIFIVNEKLQLTSFNKIDISVFFQSTAMLKNIFCISLQSTLVSRYILQKTVFFLSRPC